MTARKSEARKNALLHAAIWLVLLLIPQWTFAANYFSRVAGPVNWSAAGSWSTTGCGGGSAGGAEPGGGAGDTATICNGHTIVLDLTPANALTTLTVNGGGTLNIGNSNTARTLTVTGNISNSGTLQVPTTSNTTHSIVVGGNVTNNGTLNLASDGGSTANLTFNRNGDQTLTGTGGTTNLRNIRLNMTSTNNILDVTALSNLTFTNGVQPFVTPITTAGTFRLNATAPALTSIVNNNIPNNLRIWVNGGSLTNTATLTIAAGGTLQVDSGTFSGGTNLTIAGSYDVNGGTNTVTGNMTVNNGGQATVDGGSLAVNGGTGVTVNTGGALRVNNGTVTIGDELLIAGGTVRIDNGTVTVGNAANERVLLQDTGASTFQMNGGALNCVRFTSDTANGGTLFEMTNGTITVGVGGANTTNSAFGAPFFIGSDTQFNLSNGMIVVQSDNTAGAAREYDVNATNSNVTGGTVQIGNASTGAGEVFQVDSVPPLPHFTINATNNPAVTMLTDVSVVGNWTKNSTGTFTPGAFTVTMSGNTAQTIGGTQSTTFNNLTIANTSGGVSLTQSQTVSGTLTLSSGTFAVDANTLTLNGPAIAGTSTNLSTTGSSSIAFGGAAAGVFLPSSVASLSNLTVNNTNGVTLNGNVTAGGTPGLTLTAGPVFTGLNTVTASVNCPAGMTRTAGHVSGNLRMAFAAGAPNCIFHLGDGTNYSPLQLNFSSATAGQLTAMAARTPVTLDHPNTTAGTSGVLLGTSVNRYWSLKDSGVAGTATATFSYLVADNDSVGSAGSYTLRRGSNCAGTGSTRTCLPWLGITLSSSNTTTAVAPISITVGAGAESDLAIGVLDPSINFQRERQFIYTREQY